ncbi:hypothetical protein F5884DRAFT_856403 [Xylogone sp. PMI_703]|nr:hypothetical protein F5884DRAFT_856403 [Xylogone sp. PMI_703]
MVGYTLSQVLGFNTKLKDPNNIRFGAGLVGLFVGGTSGIGETTLKAFARHAISPRIYVVGRSQESYDRIATEVKNINSDAKLTFLPADCSELKEVDRVCKEVIKLEEGQAKGGPQINFLVLTAGFMSLKGRNESPEGLDRKMACHYYGRIRFIDRLQPLLDAASAANKPSRVISVLGGGMHEGELDANDLGLRKNFSVSNCAKYSVNMTTLAFEDLAKKHPGTAYVHSAPGAVKTGYMRSVESWYTKPLLGAFMFLAKPWVVEFEESGERHVFAGLSGMEKWVARKDAELSKDCEKGSDGENGSGFYCVGPKSENVVNGPAMKKLREEGFVQKVAEHTREEFERIEKLNAAK